MTTALLVITDGRRDCIAKTIPSAMSQLCGTMLNPRVIYDDSGDPVHRQWLIDTFSRYGFAVIWHEQGRQGFGGAIATAWARLHMVPRTFDFVFHLEDDFTFNRAINVGAMELTLDAHPHLAQLALRRQPWNPEEAVAGGVVELHPDAFTEVAGCYGQWLEHRQFWTTNPSLYRRSLLERSWPTGAKSEGMFTAALLDDPALRFGYWGDRASGEAVHHIGHQRVGIGY